MDKRRGDSNRGARGKPDRRSAPPGVAKEQSGERKFDPKRGPHGDSGDRKPYRPAPAAGDHGKPENRKFDANRGARGKAGDRRPAFDKGRRDQAGPFRAAPAASDHGKPENRKFDANREARGKAGFRRPAFDKGPRDQARPYRPAPVDGEHGKPENRKFDANRGARGKAGFRKPAFDKGPRDQARPHQPALAARELEKTEERKIAAPPAAILKTPAHVPAKRIGRGKSGKRKSGSFKARALAAAQLAARPEVAADDHIAEHLADHDQVAHETQSASPTQQRLQKILSQAGITSRRKAEQLILEGRVSVNGRNVTELGSKADLEQDHIKVDGQLLRPPKRHIYIALNKPKNVVTTVSDPEGRQTVMHLLRGVRERVFPVGRLDFHSEGLLLLTSDGEFAHRITSPAQHVIKTYVVKTNGALTPDQEKIFREGIPLHGRKTSPAELKQIKHGANPWYEVKIAEGRQNQIRVMFQYFGRLVEKLRRVKIGFLELDQAPGRYRPLDAKEVERFRKLLKLE